MPYTHLQIIGQARQLLNDATQLFWTDAELNDWSIQGVLDVSAKARCCEDTFLQDIDPGNQMYQVPSHIIGVETIIRPSTGHALAKWRPRQFGHVSGGGDTAPSAFAHFADRLLFHPVPGAAETLLVLGWSVRTDLIFLPEEYHGLVLLFMLKMARLKEQRYAEAAQLNAMYLTELQFQRQDLQEREPDTKETLRLADRVVRNGR